MTMTIFTADMGIRLIMSVTTVPPNRLVSGDTMYTTNNAKASRANTAKMTNSASPPAPA